MYEIEKGSKHRGYYYRVSDALTIMICGMLCSLQNISDEELLKHARLEWTVESMHWLLDVHFLEDKTKVWDMNGTTNFKYYAKNSFEFSKRVQKTL